MATTYKLSKNTPDKKQDLLENLRFYFLLFLVGMLVAVFAFWQPTKESGYRAGAFDKKEVVCSEAIGKPDTEALYKTIITRGDAIRSVFQ